MIADQGSARLILRGNKHCAFDCFALLAALISPRVLTLEMFEAFIPLLDSLIAKVRIFGRNSANGPALSSIN
jgi:hypothetical protein